MEEAFRSVTEEEGGTEVGTFLAKLREAASSENLRTGSWPIIQDPPSIPFAKPKRSGLLTGWQ